MAITKPRAQGSLEIGVVKLEPVHSPGGAPGGAGAVLGVLGGLLAKAGAAGAGAAQGVRAGQRHNVLHSDTALRNQDFIMCCVPGAP
jgi:hypothetical protein